ncbi:chorismate mutase [Alicyclobacillus acidocaldarius]|uniref:Chorismate mutase n=1 Tax=Alicyclobacillus acidocaldarius subsp. acidocaldarius (strain ATCC 27009 / DSM 446 / BCRC 14685 / JCM 5260 / KCTC 1825 / NBRC 15652 / NCIMB 11725 / NRRL B-14509 / 104-IA) TaxID=521098 RepID=C8WRU2_ALIAD|nr:chorismate mutase [Alicyclobacillus acidocaldarius]ACV59353.1 Chorismate mutase [Alicyclobacillus acidocaldarius subsp. acidocaldarius DSM 446]
MQRPLNEEIRELRKAIDHIDEHILTLLVRRFSIADEIAEHKARRGQAIVQPERAQQVRARYLQSGAALGLSPTFLAALWKLVHDESCRRQTEHVKALERSQQSG